MNALLMAPDDDAAAGLSIGEPAPAAEGLLGTDGRAHGIPGPAAGTAVVVVFSSNRCPTAKAYDERMRDLVDDYGSRGLTLLAVNSNDPHLHPDESYDRMRERAADGAFSYSYVVDDGQSLARAFGASCTFHVFLLDGERRLRYEGRFDDSRIPGRVTSHDLRDALDEVLAGRAVSRPITRPFGCSLELM
jgi:hypothetical protein